MAENPVVQKLEKALSASGFDVCVPFQLQRYNEVAPGKARVPCSRFSAGGAALGILFGNSKAMWDFFLAACGKDDGKLIEGSSPLDTYVKAAVLEALETAAPGQGVKIYWGNDQHDDLEGGKGYVAIQALAAGLGMCYLDKGSHLCVHPVYGPWFSLRGFMVLEGLSYQPPDTAVYEPLPNPLTKEQQDRVSAAMQAALKPADEQSEGGATYTGVREQWRKWLEVRTSLHYPEQHPWQYNEQQIVYHYTSNRDVLRSCVKEARSKEEEPPDKQGCRIS